MQQLTAEVQRLQGFQTKAEEWDSLSDEVTRLRHEISSAQVTLAHTQAALQVPDEQHVFVFAFVFALPLPYCTTLV